MSKVIVLIPTFNPLSSFIQYVEQLKQKDIEKIVIVNDGSGLKYTHIFEKLKSIDQCVVLEHAQNFGKGKALKTGFEYIMKYEKKAHGVLTVGAHDQHTMHDIEQMIMTMELFSDGIVLGVREFRSEDLPIFSYWSNRIASLLFELLFHKRLLDIQTGLRYIPKQELLWVHKVNGDDYTFDTNMLVEAIERNIPIYELPIGKVRVKKNSIIYYDEILNPKLTFKQIWATYQKNKKR